MKDEKYNFTCLRLKKIGKFGGNSPNFEKEGRKKRNFRQKYEKFPKLFYEDSELEFSLYLSRVIPTKI